MKSELVINYHLLLACNFNCHYCYALWNIKRSSMELHHDLRKIQLLLEEVYAYFQSLGFQKIRLTLAGGEPLLLKNLNRIIEVAYRVGFQISIITNGSRITEEFIIQQTNRVSVIGFSIDTTHTAIMHKVGRTTKSNIMLDLDILIQHIQLLRFCNPNILVKINTVVNQYNFKENMTDFINQVKPDKWKVLRVLPIIKKGTAITDQQFLKFLQTHQKFSDIWTVEDNEAMIGSYIMIDPLGRFFDNSQNQNTYIYSDPILQVGVQKAFQQIHFDLSKFMARYKSEIHMKQAS